MKDTKLSLDIFSLYEAQGGLKLEQEWNGLKMGNETMNIFGIGKIQLQQKKYVISQRWKWINMH